MSTWRCFEIEATLATALHCGDRPLGFVSRTFGYVPQHIPLFALVPVMVAVFGLPDESKIYSALEGFCLNHVCFLPLFIHNPEGRALYPWQEGDRKEIESEYIGSGYGVAIDYGTRGAIENRFFEKEIIFPVRRGDGKPTIIKGYIFLKEGHLEVDSKTLTINFSDGSCCINGKKLSDIIKECQWGGDRNKGLGALKSISIRPSSSENSCGQFDDSGSRPLINWPKNEPAPFLLEYYEGISDKISGTLKPVSGRRYDPERGPGLLPAEPFVAWQPGWKSSESLKLSLTFNRTEIADTT